MSGEGGRLGVKGATLAQYVAQSLVKRKPDKYENDPRAAILRHAKEAAENPFWIDPAYKKSAPYSDSVYLLLFRLKSYLPFDAYSHKIVQCSN